MTYVCIECGAEFEYDAIVKAKMKCTSCTEKRSNIWIKKRPEHPRLEPKEVLAR